MIRSCTLKSRQICCASFRQTNIFSHFFFLFLSIAKHLWLAPRETVRFVSPQPRMLRVLGKKNSLFSAGPVIKCLFTFADQANVVVTTRFSGQAGDMMTIYCTAIGPTTSTFTWTKDHLALQPSYRVKYAVNSTFSSLTIRMTRKADSGNYTCKVRCT